MPSYSTEAEQRLLQQVWCPDCDAPLGMNAARCRACGLLLARGSLLGIRMPRHARASGAKRDWVRRFLRGS